MDHSAGIGLYLAPNRNGDSLLCCVHARFHFEMTVTLFLKENMRYKMVTAIFNRHLFMTAVKFNSLKELPCKVIECGTKHLMRAFHVQLDA